MSFTEHKTDEQSNLILALDSLAILETEAKHPWLRDHIDNISKVLVAYGQLLNRVGEIQAKYTAEKGKREYAERFVCCKEVLVFGIHSHEPQGRGSRKEGGNAKARKILHRS